MILEFNEVIYVGIVSCLELLRYNKVLLDNLKMAFIDVIVPHEQSLQYDPR